jgi:hypothetical protein
MQTVANRHSASRDRAQDDRRTADRLTDEAGRRSGPSLADTWFILVDRSESAATQPPPLHGVSTCIGHDDPADFGVSADGNGRRPKDRLAASVAAI